MNMIEYTPPHITSRTLREEQEANALLRNKIRLLEAQAADLQRTADHLATENFRMRQALERIKTFAGGYVSQSMRHVWKIAVKGLTEGVREE